MNALCRILPGLLAAGMTIIGNGAAAAEAACPAAANLFPAQTWQPPPPSPRRQQPERPQAPPLPFVYLGQLQEERGIVLFLARGQNTLVVREGDSIDGAYRIDHITPVRATFVYLPLNEPQHLTLRSRP